MFGRADLLLAAGVVYTKDVSTKVEVKSKGVPRFLWGWSWLTAPPPPPYLTWGPCGLAGVAEVGAVSPQAPPHVVMDQLLHHSRWTPVESRALKT